MITEKQGISRIHAVDVGDRDRLGRFQSASRRLVPGAESIHRLVSHCRSPDAFGEMPKAADEDVRRTEYRLLRQKLDQYIRHYFGGQRNEGLDRHQMELLLQGLPNVITLPTPEPKPAAAARLGTPHPVRRMLAA
jgi:hypothetical protein